ncbi:Akirin1 [Acrasis kona]|uniref:Akirin1 n=1 Tax=Acrasis kona TaxID=1008807 RepID=A0AAW2ZE64_9EUKA
MTTAALKRSYDTFLRDDMNDEDMINGSPTTCSNVKFVFNQQQQQQILQQQQEPTMLANQPYRDLLERPFKRRREHNVHQLLQQHHNEQTDSNPRSLLQSTLTISNKYSHFPQPSDVGIDAASDFVSSYKKQRRSQQKKEAAVSTNPKQASFSEEEVKYILEVRERQIKEEYNKILSELLSEQFNQFSKFSQDCISRQFKSSDFSYTS